MPFVTKRDLEHELNTLIDTIHTIIEDINHEERLSRLRTRTLQRHRPHHPGQVDSSLQGPSVLGMW